MSKRQIIDVRTRDIGYGSESYYGTAFITDEVDTWGKRTVLIENGDQYEQWYLFDDEWKAE